MLCAVDDASNTSIVGAEYFLLLRLNIDPVLVLALAPRYFQYGGGVPSDVPVQTSRV